MHDPLSMITPAPPDAATARRIAALGYDPAAQAQELPAGCNLCGARERQVEMAHRDRYGYPTTLVVCGRCGLGYLSPRLTAAAYAHFYDRVYRPLVSAYHNRRIDAETVQGDQRAYAVQLADFLGPWLSSPPRAILDVGGSTGVVGKILGEQLGGRVTVLDPSPGELAVARAAGIETVAGFVEDFDPGERRWDLVLLCQTIDHLLDVGATLAALRRMTSSVGRAFVDVLDVDWVRERVGSIGRCVKVDHPFYLSRLTAEAFLGLAGFTVVAERLAGDGHWGFVLVPGQRRPPDWPALESRAAAFLAETVPPPQWPPTPVAGTD